MADILIIGANGNLGQAFKNLYGERATYVDRDDLDITNEASVDIRLLELSPKVVINCAAYNAVDKAEMEADAAMQVNGFAPGFLAKACSKIDATLIQYSTHYVFSGVNENGYNENATPDARSSYAKSKAFGEKQVALHTNKYYIIRTAWLYGKNPLGGKKSFIDLILERAKAEETVKAVNDEIAHPTYVKDLAEATQELLQENQPFGIYHLTNSGTASWYDWAKEIFAIKGMNVTIEPVPASTFPRPVMRPHFGIINNTKVKPLRDWKDALREFLTS